jgi:ATP-dependent RNA helicase RhlE
MGFEKFQLDRKIIQSLEQLEYKEPTPIQNEVIPDLLRGKDLLAIAKTGTGKTAAFVLPMLQKILQQKEQNSDEVYLSKLIIAPTRELVLQLEKSITQYGANLDIKIASIYGGSNINPQIKKLQKKVDIVIATTGRLLDLLEQKKISLAKVDTLVLDEADSMLDMGFINDVGTLIAQMPKREQTILCSATLGSHVKKLANEILISPKVIELKAKDKVNEKIEQIAYPVTQEDKLSMLSFLIGSQNMQQVLVFCKTKALADEIVEHLKLDGLKSMAVHGDKTIGARKKAIEQFKEHKIRVLVSTDVASRGLDIQDLFFVINYDLPFSPIDYIHRIGRTARAGNEGLAISLLDQFDMAAIGEIEEYIKQKIPKLKLDGFETDPKIHMIAKKKIIKPQQNEKKSKVGGAFGKKKAKKEAKKAPKIKGKRIIGQKKHHG